MQRKNEDLQCERKVGPRVAEIDEDAFFTTQLSDLVLCMAGTFGFEVLGPGKIPNIGFSIMDSVCFSATFLVEENDDDVVCASNHGLTNERSNFASSVDGDGKSS